MSFCLYLCYKFRYRTLAINKVSAFIMSLDRSVFVDFINIFIGYRSKQHVGTVSDGHRADLTMNIFLYKETIHMKQKSQYLSWSLLKI